MLSEEDSAFLMSIRQKIPYNKDKKKVVFYTAIFNKYDILRPTFQVNHAIDYYCFTDDVVSKNEPWKNIYVSTKKSNAGLINRILKFFPTILFPDYEYSIYIDGNIAVLNDPYHMLDSSLATSDLACIKHPDRDCIYDEASVCIFKEKDNSDLILKQMESYRSEGFPSHLGLGENGILFRRHTKQLNDLMLFWWREMNLNSKRDQLSLVYSSWKISVPIYLINSSRMLARLKIYRESLFYYFSHSSHKSDNLRQIYKFFRKSIAAFFRKEISLSMLLRYLNPLKIVF